LEYKPGKCEINCSGLDEFGKKERTIRSFFYLIIFYIQMEIEKAKKEECFWCKSKTPKIKKGWILYKFQNFPNHPLLFCSKKCLSRATVDGKGNCLSINKIAAKQRRINNSKNKENMRVLIQKEKLNDEDLAQLFLCLSAKQKKFLAGVGLAHMSWSVNGNPKMLMDKIDQIINGG